MVYIDLIKDVSERLQELENREAISIMNLSNKPGIGESIICWLP